MTKYWVVRAHKDIQDIVELDGFIGIGFGGDELGDLAGLSREEIRPRIESARPDRAAGYYGTAAGQLWRFVNKIEEGDCLLTPHKRTRNVRIWLVRIGLVRGAYEFKPGHPRPHRRPVDWIRTASRDDLPPIKRRLTVSSFQRHADELAWLLRQ